MMTQQFRSTDHSYWHLYRHAINFLLFCISSAFTPVLFPNLYWPDKVQNTPSLGCGRASCFFHKKVLILLTPSIVFEGSKRSNMTFEIFEVFLGDNCPLTAPWPSRWIMWTQDDIFLWMNLFGGFFMSDRKNSRHYYVCHVVQFFYQKRHRIFGVMLFGSIFDNDSFW